MARLCRKFNTAICNGSLVITIKPRAKPSLHSCQIILHSTEVANICATTHHTSHKNPNVRRGSDAPVFRVCLSAILLLVMQVIKRFYVEVASYGTIFMPSFVAISHQIQNMKRTDTKRHNRRQWCFICLFFYFF